MFLKEVTKGNNYYCLAEGVSNKFENKIIWDIILDYYKHC